MGRSSTLDLHSFRIEDVLGHTHDEAIRLRRYTSCSQLFRTPRGLLVCSISVAVCLPGLMQNLFGFSSLWQSVPDGRTSSALRRSHTLELAVK